jgi:exodeoxyribonuclease V gamma subunit
MTPALKDEPQSANDLAVSGFHLHRSNRLESLVGTLAELVRSPLRSPLAQETVLVQSQGMARWLKLQLAERLGVAANLRFPFPRAFAHELFRALDLTVDARPSFDPELLVWRLFKLLPSAARRPGFESVARYLADGDERKQFQLAGRLARLFDQYLVYRPDLILAWENDDANWQETFQAEPQDAWQAQLWHLIGAGWAAGHPATWHREFLRRAQAGTLPADRLPERMAVFGVSALPPFHLDLLSGLGRVTEVHFFLLQPTEHYWGDLRSRREQALHRRRRATPQAESLSEEGHPLLASLGRTGRELLDLLLEGEAHDAEEHFEATNPTRLLGRLQAAMLTLQARSSGEPRARWAATDDSIRVHSCHSPLREVEVLRDHLLAWFDDDPTLQPRDVIVMVPDLDTYAPLLEALFIQPERPNEAIPFSLADQSPRAGGLGAALWQALEVADGDFGAVQLLSLLERPLVRQHFGLDEDDVERVRHWVRAAEIRWGRDAEHTGTHHATGGQSWRAGLDRLLLSYALGGEDELVVCGIARSVTLEGGDAEGLGGFCRFAETLIDFSTLTETPVPPRDWADRIEALFSALLGTGGEAQREAEPIRAALATLRDAQRWAGCDQPLSFAVIREHLGAALAEDRRGSGFLLGGVTICGLKPMRSIPFKVVCLLGMNHGVFPRQSTPLAFDLTARRRRTGDSSPRDDDRYLFLETLLSARERLHLSYVGQSQRDGKDIPPGVVVSELLDHLDHEFETEDGSPLRSTLLVQHRLQAFSPDYFSGDLRFSFSQQNHAAAEAYLRPRREPQPPLAGSVAPAATDDPLSLATLIRFFRNPAKHFAEQRLSFRLPRAEETLPEEERFNVDRRENYGLVEAGVAALRSGGRVQDLLTLQGAAGRLPTGPLESAERSRLERETTEFWNRCEPHFKAGARWVAGEFKSVTGSRLPDRVELFGPVLVRERYSAVETRPDLLLATWIELLWTATQDDTVTHAVIIGRVGTVTLRRPAQPAALLESLLELYQQGQHRVLPFACKAAYLYVQKWRGKVRDETQRERACITAARTAWNPNPNYADAPPAESEEEAMQLAYAGGDLPGEPEFAAVSQAIFEPLMDHQEVGA